MRKSWILTTFLIIASLLITACPAAAPQGGDTGAAAPTASDAAAPSGTGGTREDSALDGSLHSFQGAQLAEPGGLALALAALAALSGWSRRQRSRAGHALRVTA